MALRASIIIPHYNDLENLEACLRLLAKQTVPASEYEIVIADNNSKCGITAVQEAAGDRARVILAKEQGAGLARNAGVAAAQGEVLAFIDSDCRARPEWLAEGLAALESSDVIGGRVVVEPAIADRMTPAEAFEAVFAFRFDKYVTRDRFTGAGNMFVRKADFEKIGGFLAAVSEDKEWSQRAIAMGYRLDYAPRAVVGHPARRNFEELKSKWRRMTRESYLLARGRNQSKVAIFARALAVLVSPIPHSFMLLLSPRVPRFKDSLRAIPILWAIRFYRFVETVRLMIDEPTAKKS